MRALVIVAVLAWASTARAEETRTEYYTLQVLAADGVALGLVGVGIAIFADGTDAGLSSEPNNASALISQGLGLALLGVLTYAIAPPIVHAVHGRDDLVLEIALRVGLPVVGAVIGAYVAYTAGAIALGTLGGVAAMVIDWTELAHHEIPVTPVVAPHDGGGTVGLAGAF